MRGALRDEGAHHGERRLRDARPLRGKGGGKLDGAGGISTCARSSASFSAAAPSAAATARSAWLAFRRLFMFMLLPSLPRGDLPPAEP